MTKKIVLNRGAGGLPGRQILSAAKSVKSVPEVAMALRPILAEAVLSAKTGVLKDEAVNTFAILQDDAIAIDAVGGILDHLISFYNDVGAGQTNAVAHWIARDRLRTSEGCLFKFYNLTGHLNGTPHGAPILISPWTLPDGIHEDGLPAECAVSLSFHSAYGAAAEFAPGARPRSRDRGRVFLGPLVRSAAVDTGPGDTVRPSSVLVTDFAFAGAALLSGLPAAGGSGAWSIWSRRNAALTAITTVWVDDAFDTIRGRGPLPTAKTFGVGV